MPSVSTPFNVFIAMKFVKWMARPFKTWPAYTMGLIDDKGKKIRSPETEEECRQFAPWMNLVRNIKRFLSTVPGGSSAFASYAAAFAMLREGVETELGRTLTATENVDLELCLEDSFGAPRQVLLERSRDSEWLQPGLYMVTGGFANLMTEGAFRTVLVKEKTESKQILNRAVFRLIDSAGEVLHVCRSELHPVQLS